MTNLSVITLDGISNRASFYPKQRETRIETRSTRTKTVMDSRLAKLQQGIAAAIDGLSSQDLLLHPAGKWCAAEVLEHLYLTYTGTVKGFERVLTGGKPLVHGPTLRQRLRTFLVVGLSHMPEGRKSPSVAQPRGVPAEQVQSQIGPTIAAMDKIITRCEERFGRRKKVLDHPILGPLTVGEWRKFHLVHGLHHVKQLHRLRKMRG